MADQEGAAVPAGQKSSWSSFVKQILSSTGDLSSLSAPSFILSSTSLTEFSAYWGEPTQELLDTVNGPTPEERMLLVLKWFISTLKGQYTARETQTGSEKKPFNPVLGELFLGQWTTSQGSTSLVSEQVSHHPPITAYHIENKQAGVSLSGHNGQKTTFSGTSIIVRQVGFAVLTLALKSGPETYLISLPRLKIEGLVYGSPYVELTDTSFIQSSSGFHTNIAYSGKGWMSGKSHTFKASVAPNHSNLSSPLYTIEGQWTDASKYAKPTSGKLHAIGQSFLDVGRASSIWKAVEVKPVAEQGELESRRVWQAVADGIRKGDFENATAAKTKLENEQRAKRKSEAATGQPHKPKYFEQVANDPTCSKLVSMCDASLPDTDAWQFKDSA